MATKTQPVPTASFILSEGEGAISRSTVTIITGQNLAAGTVLGMITASSKYTAHAPAASDGSQNAVAVLYEAVDATSADKKAVVINRMAEVADNGLTWSGSITTPQKTTALAKLAETFVIVR